MGLLMGAHFSVNGTKLHCMGPYWPAYAPQRPPEERAKSDQLEYRTKDFLLKSGSPETTTNDYIKGLMNR